MKLPDEIFTVEKTIFKSEFVYKKHVLDLETYLNKKFSKVEKIESNTDTKFRCYK